MSIIKGYQAEQLAGHFLTKNGLDIIARNYRCKGGEIDLVCRDKNTVVFVEVRSRAATGFASAKESVTLTKQQRLIRAAHLFLLEKKWTESYPCRFDVVALQMKQEDMKIEWIKDAFICG